LRRVHTLAGWIQQYFRRRRVLGPRIESGRLDLAHFSSSIARGTLDELFRHTVGVRIARLADIVQ
jgi:hypothetical protein